MTPKQRLDILLADDGSQHAQAPVEWLQNVSLPPKSRIFVFRAFHPGSVSRKLVHYSECSVLVVKGPRKD